MAHKARIIFRPFFCHFYSWPPFRPLSAIVYSATSSTLAQKERKPFRPLSANLLLSALYTLFDKNKVKAISLLHTLQSIMTECQCMHVVVQDQSLVVCASHECLGLLLRADIESLVVDALEATLDHCISLLLCLKDALVQLDVLHAHSLTVNHDVARYSLCCIVHYILLINQSVHLRSQSHEFSDTMSVVFVLEDGSRQLLVEVEERFQ